MTTFYRHLQCLACLLGLVLSAHMGFAQEGAFQSYPTIVCPGEQTTLRLTVADNITVADAPALTNATLVFYPAKTGNVIDCTVRWNDVAAQGTVVFKLIKTVKNNDNTTTETPVVSPTVTVGIQSVRDRMPALINGTTSLSVPLCSNGQPITFTLPQEYFAGASSVPITNYVWQVPTGYQVVNPITSPDFPGGYLSGRSLSVIPPASTTGGIVRVYQYSRACNENTNFNNPRGTLISLPRELLISRPVPTITAVTASRPALTCGDQRPLTLSAATSQPGASSFIWTLPPGWNYVPNTPTNTATVSVVPNGANGGQATVRAYYSCVNYTTPASPASNVSIGFDQRVAPPATSPSLTPNADGTLRSLCGPTSVTATAVGATSYRWSTTNGILVNGGTTAQGDTVTLTPPAGIIGTGQVTVESLNSGSGCQPGSVTYSLTYGAPPVRDRFDLRGYCFDYAANGPANSFLVCPGENLSITPALLNFAGQSYEGEITQWQWTLAGGGSALPGSSGTSRFFFTAPNQPRQTFTITLRLSNSCGTSQTGSAQFTTLDTNGGEQPYRVANPKPKAYPNPADATLTVEQAPGTLLTIYNAQGRAMYKARAGKLPLQVDTHAWPEGLYYVQQHTGTGTERQQLQIKH